MISPIRRLELLFWAAAPALITLLLLVLYLAPKHVSGLDRFMPLLPLIPVFYWGMMHARDMPYWFAFLLGLVMDAATGKPMGLSSLLFILFLAMLHAQRRHVYKEGFVVKWAYFSLLLLILIAVDWLMLSLLHSRALDASAAFFQWFLTVACYPLLHRFFDRLFYIIGDRRWRILHGQ